jgi:hypothetical protein
MNRFHQALNFAMGGALAIGIHTRDPWFALATFIPQLVGGIIAIGLVWSFDLAWQRGFPYRIDIRIVRVERP